MKKLIAAAGVLGSLALCSPALAAGLIVKNGQSVTLPCVVTGAVDVQAGGSIFTNNECRSTTIQGALDIHPGATAELCYATVDGSLVARAVGSASFFDVGTVKGATLNDGSLATNAYYCGSREIL